MREPPPPSQALPAAHRAQPGGSHDLRCQFCGSLWLRAALLKFLDAAAPARLAPGAGGGLPSLTSPEAHSRCVCSQEGRTFVRLWACPVPAPSLPGG